MKNGRGWTPARTPGDSERMTVEEDLQIVRGDPIRTRRSEVKWCVVSWFFVLFVVENEGVMGIRRWTSVQDQYLCVCTSYTEYLLLACLQACIHVRALMCVGVCLSRIRACVTLRHVCARV